MAQQSQEVVNVGTNLGLVEQLEKKDQEILEIKRKALAFREAREKEHKIQLDSFKTKVKAAVEQKIKALESQNKEKDLLVEDLKQRCKDEQQKSASSEQRIQVLQEELTLAKESLQDSINAQASTTMQTDIQKQDEQGMKHVQSLEHDLQAANQRVQEAEMKVASHIQSMEENKSEVLKYQDIVEKQRETIDGLKAEHDAKVLALEGLQSELATAQAEVEAAKSKISEMEANDQSSVVEELRSGLAAAQAEVEATKSKISEMEANDQSSVVEELRSELAAAQAEVEAAKSKISEMKANDQSSVVEELRNELAAAQAEVEAARASSTVIEEVDSLREKHASEVLAFETKQREHIEEFEALQSKYEALRSREVARSEDLSDAIAEKDTRISSLQEELSTLQSKLDSINQELTTAKTECSENEAQRHELQTQLSALEQQSAESKEQWGAREQTLNESITALREAAQARQTETNSEFKRLSVEVSDLRAKLEAARGEALQRQQEYEQQLMQSSEQQDNLKRMLREAQEQVDSLESELSTVKGSLSTKDAEISAANEQARSARESEAHLQTETEAAVAEQHRLDVIAQEAEVKVAEAIAQCRELEATVESLRSELKSQRKDAVDKKQKAKAYVESLLLEKKNAIAHARTEAKRSAKAAIEVEVAKRSEELSKARDQFQSEKQALAEKLKSREEELEELKNKVQDTVNATKKTAEELQMNEAHMNKLIETKVHETEHHKKLRQSAKQETLALARKLEKQELFVRGLDSMVEKEVLPKAQQMATVTQEIEWNLDAAISAALAQRDSSRGVVRSTSAGSQTAIEMNDTRAEEGTAPVSHTGSRSGLNVEAQNHVQLVHAQLLKAHEAQHRVLEKVQQVCDLAVGGSQGNSFFGCDLQTVWRLIQDWREHGSTSGPGRVVAAATGPRRHRVVGNQGSYSRLGNSTTAVEEEEL